MAIVSHAASGGMLWATVATWLWGPGVRETPKRAAVGPRHEAKAPFKRAYKL